MFIFENNFNLLSPHFGKKQHPQGHSKPRWAVGRLFQLFIHLMDVCKPEKRLLTADSVHAAHVCSKTRCSSMEELGKKAKYLSLIWSDRVKLKSV